MSPVGGCRLLAGLLAGLFVAASACYAAPSLASPTLTRPEIVVALPSPGEATAIPAERGQPDQPTCPAAEPGLEESPQPFTFAVTADMRLYSGPGQYDSPSYFRGACEAIAALGGADFMVSPGDIDPPDGVLWTIQEALGPGMVWYPVVGNHEVETPDDMAWLRTYDYGPVNAGPSGCPETTYSFDYENAHFVVLNEYCDVSGDTVTDGDVPDHLYEWLVADLNATAQSLVFVFGHEPASPQPDADNGRERHMGDSLNAHPDHRDRFWDLLQDEGVVAYVCGHTHNYSAVQVGQIWQLDAGHARGQGDTGARSTFLLIRVDGDTVVLETYRDDAAGGPYTLTDVAILAGGSPLYLPLVARLMSDA